MKNLDVNTNYDDTKEDDLIVRQTKIMNKDKQHEDKARADFQLNICDGSDSWKN